MDLLLRGCGAAIGASAPSWLVRLAGGALGYAALAVADRLGFTEVLGVSPLIMRGGAIVVGALLAPTPLGALLWLGTGVLVFTSMVVAFTPLVQAPALTFVRNDRGADSVDAVVVLSGSMTDAGMLSSQVLERLLSALDEARRRHVLNMALSVIEDGSGTHHVTSEADQRALMALLAPEMTTYFVHDVASTHDEALQFAALASRSHWHRVALVTSPMHTRRACRTFEVAGLPVSCVAAESRVYSLPLLRGAGARLNVFQDLLYESAATTLYRLRGWI
jgi:uncharacterized SAM-binding protein YcdF (DUF218 family)